MAIQVFGAGAIQTAYVSYSALNTTSGNILLYWPNSSVSLPFTGPGTLQNAVLSARMEVNTPVMNTNYITLPNATEATVGENFIMKNVGLSNFTLKKSDGTALQVMAPGISYYVQLTNSTTSIGVWSVDTFAAGTSEASADILAGYGLTPIGLTLNTNVPIRLTSVPVAITTASRAQMIVWQGSVNTQTLPAIGSVPAGFYIAFNNEGSGTLTIRPGEGGTLIDGLLDIQVALRQSLYIISDGTNWWTLGFGQNQFAVSTVLSLDVSASVNVTLTDIQAANIVQKYTGILTSNIKVFFPESTNYWFVNNLTTGAHTLSVQLEGPLGSSFVIPQGSSAIVYSDSTTMYMTPTGTNSLILNTPLALSSGGTGATDQLSAAISVLPGPPDIGDTLYFDGDDWNRLSGGTYGSIMMANASGIPFWFPPGLDNQVLTIDNVTHLPKWV